MSRATPRSLDLEPIDRLEEKVQMLVAKIDRLKAEYARTAEDNARLSRELEATQARLTDADASSEEISALRLERETIRGRVTDMLEQLEALEL